MSPNFPPSVPELVGKEVRLRELTEADIPGWYARATDAESAQFAGDPVPASVEEGAAWLRRHRERFAARTAIRWAIVLAGGGESIGTVGLALDSTDPRIGELGIVIGRRHWGRGLGTAAASVVVGYGLNQLGLQEVRAEVIQRNPASVRLLEKAGFHLVRAVPAEATDDGEPCFHYSVHAPTGRAG